MQRKAGLLTLMGCLQHSPQTQLEGIVGVWSPLRHCKNPEGLWLLLQLYRVSNPLKSRWGMGLIPAKKEGYLGLLSQSSDCNYEVTWLGLFSFLSTSSLVAFYRVPVSTYGSIVIQTPDSFDDQSPLNSVERPHPANHTMQVHLSIKYMRSAQAGCS